MNSTKEKIAAVLFAGGGGLEIALEILGIKCLLGIEYDDQIASVARANGFPTKTADILKTNPRDFLELLRGLYWLHASPPCPNFSNAKAGAEETENDLALARKVAEWVTVHKPSIFTLENVIAYRKSKSWRIILDELYRLGYWVDVAHVNFADYGVPQTRKRMIVRAKLGAFIPYLRPTHDKNGANGLPRWIGWHRAIEDLIPTLPLSTKRGACDYSPTGDTCANTPECRGHFAEWQKKRLPAEFSGSLFVDGQLNGGELYTKREHTPMLTIKASADEKSRMPRAFIMNEGNPNGNKKRKYRNDDEPTKTVTAGGMVTRAFLFDDGNTKEGCIKDEGEPMEPVRTGVSVNSRANINDRIVKMTVQCLARFQTFPDDYKGATTRIIGNAVPPVGFANVCRDLL